MTKEEFKKLAEQALKRWPDMADNIELCEITLEEENALIQFLMNTNDVQSSWTIGQEIIAKGYSNGIPFIVYQAPNNEKSGVLVIGNAVIKYYDDKENYDEHVYANDIKTQINKSSTPGRYNAKTVAVEYDSDDAYISYCEAQYNNTATVEEAIIDKSEEVNRVYRDLVAKKRINEQNETWYDEGYQSYYLDKAFLVNSQGKSDLARLSTLYTSSNYYLGEISLPKMISIKERTKKSARYFILIKTGNYIDVNTYLEEGFDAAVITIDEIEAILANNGLTIKACEILENWIGNDGIPTKNVQKIVDMVNKKKEDTITRTLKND